MTSEEILKSPPTSHEGIVIDLLLLDATMDDDLSIRVAAQIRSVYPACKIVLLIAAPANHRIFDFAQIGSDGYLSEGIGVEDVRIAIETVLDGRQYCSPELANALLFQAARLDHSQEPRRQRNHGVLTSREREILDLIAYQRLGNKQIARQLLISLYTVKNHVHNIIDKLGAQDRHDAVQLARRHGMLVNDITPHSDTSASRVLH